MNYNQQYYQYGGYPGQMANQGVGFPQQGQYNPAMNNPGAYAPPYAVPNPAMMPRPTPGMMQPMTNPMMGASPQNIRNTQPIQGYPMPQPASGPGSGSGAPSPYQNLPAAALGLRVAPGYPQVQNIVKFKIPHGKESSYANLYSLIMTVEELESQYCDGNMNPDDHSRLLKQFSDQFVTVQNALNLSPDDVDNFAKSMNMQCSYALTALFMPSATVNAGDESGSFHVKEAVDLGSDFTTLQDCCILGEVPASEFQDLIRKIRSRLQVMNVYPRNQQVKDYTDKWIQAFNKFKGTDIVPQNIREDLRTDIQPWRNTAIDAYQ